MLVLSEEEQPWKEPMSALYSPFSPTPLGGSYRLEAIPRHLLPMLPHALWMKATYSPHLPPALPSPRHLPLVGMLATLKAAQDPQLILIQSKARIDMFTTRREK